MGNISEGNLNRLDPTTHVVAGVKERCLKLLPPKELEQLDVPLLMDVPLVQFLDCYTSQRMHLWEGMFTCHNFKQRLLGLTCLQETKLLIRETKVSRLEAPSRFCWPSSGGGGDDLYQPIGMSKASL